MRVPPACRLVGQPMHAGDSTTSNGHGQETIPSGDILLCWSGDAGATPSFSPPRWVRVAGKALAVGRGQGCSSRVPGAELVTRGWPVMHILLTHVGMSQSPRGRGLTQQQAERRGELGLRADGGYCLSLLTASLGAMPAPAAQGRRFGANQGSHCVVSGSVQMLRDGFVEVAQSLPFVICLPQS